MLREENKKSVNSVLKFYITCGSHSDDICPSKDLVIFFLLYFFENSCFSIKLYLHIGYIFVAALTSVVHPSAVQAPALFLRQIPHILNLEQQQQQQQQQQLYYSITISIPGVTDKIKVNNKK